MTAKTAKASTKTTKTSKAKTAPAKKASAASKVTTKALVKTETKALSKKDGKLSLYNWNLRLGVVLVLFAAAIVVFGGSQTVPVTTQYLAKDALASEAAGHDVLSAAVRHLVDVRISWVVASFLAAFAVTFLLAATVLRKQYEKWLDRGVNKLRWLGYGVGTGLMAVTIAALSGIADLGYLFLIFASLVVLGALSNVADLMGAGRKLRKFVIVTALFTAALPVITIARTMFGVILFGGSLPAHVYYIYASMLLFAAAIAVACIFYLRKRGKFADMLYSEKVFMGWAFAASVVLALQVFAGALL